MSLKLGQAAPDFTLTSTKDKAYTFENYRKDHEGWHLLVFFRGGW